MKAIEIQNTFGIDSLRVVERAEPIPGARQVVVRVRAASLNYRDLMVVKGLYNPRQKLPLVPLSDGVGEVVATGEGVTRVRVGERVAGSFFQKWIDGELTDKEAGSTLGSPTDGMLTQNIVLDENGLVHPPAHLTDEEAATLPCAAVTAWHALVTKGNLQAGETVLVQGTGGVSIFALQFAVMSGARVIVTSSSDEKLARALQMGATNGINYQQTPEWQERVRELTDGRGVDHVVEVGGAGTLGRSLRAVRRSGTISLIGVLTGSSGAVNPLPILMNGVRMQGIYVGSRRMFEEMNQGIALHGMRPVVDRMFAFAEATEAFRHMEQAAHFGKIVVRIA